MEGFILWDPFTGISKRFYGTLPNGYFPNFTSLIKGALHWDLSGSCTPEATRNVLAGILINIGTTVLTQSLFKIFIKNWKKKKQKNKKKTEIYNFKTSYSKA